MYKPDSSCQILTLAEIYESNFPNKEVGFFVDVGAFDGVTFSNTSCLADAGWRGIMIEAFPEYFVKCEQHYKNSKGIINLCCAVGNHDGLVPMYHKEDALQMPTCSNKFAADWGYTDSFTMVAQYTLDDILAALSIPYGLIDVLSIDVEGGEWNVLKGFSVDTCQPRMVIIEVHQQNIDPRLRVESNVEKIEDYFTNHGYEKIYCDDINNIYVRR